MKAKHSMFTIFFYQNLVFQTFENMTFIYYTSMNKPQNIMRVTKNFFLIKEICYKNRL